MLRSELKYVIVVSLSMITSSAIHATDEMPDQGGLRIGRVGMIEVPAQAPAPAGKIRAVTGLSGITWLGDDRYAAVMDNSNCVLRFSLKLGDDGKPLAVRDAQVVNLDTHRDYEDIAGTLPRLIERREATPVSGEPMPSRCLLVCEESTPAIHWIDIATGMTSGQVEIPSNLRTARLNRSLESLAITPDGHHVWTANEEALPADGPPPTDTAGTVVRLTRVDLTDSGAASDEPPTQFAYAVDPPHRFLRVAPGDSYSGVVALIALDRSRLLVLERSAVHGTPPFENRLFCVDVSHGVNVANVEEKLAEPPDPQGAKQLVWKESLGCNLEGLCLGPTLAKGGRVLVGVADNGGLGTPNHLVTLVMEDEGKRAMTTRRDASASP